MTFDKRFQRSLSDIRTWTQSPHSADLLGVDSDARNAVVALQSQLQAMHGVLKVATGMIERGLSPELRKQFRADLDAAQEIKPPTFLTERDEDEDDWDLDEPPTTKGKKLIATDKGKPALKDIKRSDKPRKKNPPRTVAEWFVNLHAAVGIEFKPEQVLYRHQRFEQPKIILLTNTDAAYRKLNGWMHNNLDAEMYPLSFGKEEETGQRWATIPVVALAEATTSLRLPKGAEAELVKAD
jgi:hypothetical protein